MEKIKQMLTALASVTALLYGTGYIAQYAHARITLTLKWKARGYPCR